MYTVSEFRAHGGLLGPWLLKGHQTRHWAISGRRLGALVQQTYALKAAQRCASFRRQGASVSRAIERLRGALISNRR